MVNARWYVDFFDEDYLTIYGQSLTSERTEWETDHVVELLGLAPGSSVLDLCCGHGRHSIALARRGYEVTGYDLSQAFLERAEADAATAGVPVRWIEGDMRRVPFKEAFDAVINMFSAFGYLETKSEDQKVLDQVRDALKPGGLLLLDTINQAWLVRHFESRNWHAGMNDIMVLEERELNLVTGRNEVTVTMIHPDGRRRERHHAMRIYTAAELVSMVTEAGLAVEATYGGLSGEALTLESNRVVILARK